AGARSSSASRRSRRRRPTSRSRPRLPIATRSIPGAKTSSARTSACGDSGTPDAPFRGMGLHVQHRHWYEPLSPPVETHITAPIRDDTHLGPSEDLDREPDGVPHSVVGLTAFFAVFLALLLGAMFILGSWTGKVGAFILLVTAVPTIVGRLNRKADRDRD